MGTTAGASREKYEYPQKPMLITPFSIFKPSRFRCKDQIDDFSIEFWFTTKIRRLRFGCEMQPVVQAISEFE